MSSEKINIHVKVSKFKTIKLYRGLESKVLNLHTRAHLNKQKLFLHWLLTMRSSGEMQYPIFLEEYIKALEKLLRTERQYFTDDREIAFSYAKKSKGILIELTVPIHEVIKHFRIEFQNFGKRKRKFELVYVVDGSLLKKNTSRWKLKVRHLK